MKRISLRMKILSGIILAIIMMAALLLALPAQGGATLDHGYGYGYVERV